MRSAYPKCSTSPLCEGNCEQGLVPERRSVRRAHDRRVKAKTRNVLVNVWKQGADWVDARRVGKNATQHNTCGCWMCTHPHEDYNARDLRKPQLHKGEE